MMHVIKNQESRSSEKIPLVGLGTYDFLEINNIRMINLFQQANF